jgi:hypothetical protein
MSADRAPADKYPIILFASMKGGTGRTTAAANTAFLLARSGSRVLLVDGDVEAPGLSMLSAFAPIGGDDRYGGGLVDVACDFFRYWQENAAGGEYPIEVDKFIHPVLLGAEREGDAPKMNAYFQSRFDPRGTGTATARRNLSDFPRSGQLWLMPAYRNANKRPLDWDKLPRPVAHMFAGHRRIASNDEKERAIREAIAAAKAYEPGANHGPSLQDRSDLIKRLNAASGNCQDCSWVELAESAWGFRQKLGAMSMGDGEKGIAQSLDRLLEALDGAEDDWIGQIIHILQEFVRRLCRHPVANGKDAGPIDYVLVDTRSGLDPWTLHVLLPMAGQLALAAHVNEQGSGETMKFLRQVYGKDGIRTYFLDDQPPKLTWFSQILPPGENFLRHERFDVFLNKLAALSRDPEVNLATTEEKDIVQVFYNSSLPLQEDLVTLDEEPNLYPASPYWQLTERLLRSSGEDTEHLEAEIFRVLDQEPHGHFCDSAVTAMSDCDLAKAMADLQVPLTRLSYYAPAICDRYLQRLVTRHGLQRRLLALDGEHGIMRQVVYRLIQRMSRGTEATLVLSELMQMAADKGPASPVQGLARVNESRVATLEAQAQHIHVATRRFRYDLDSAFTNVVRDNLKVGKIYHYYATDAYRDKDGGSEKAWKELCERVDGWMKNPNDLGTLIRDEAESARYGCLLPVSLRREQALPPDYADLVIYGDSQHEDDMEGRPTSAVVFPAEPRAKGDAYLLIEHPDLVATLYVLLRNSRLGIE